MRQDIYDIDPPRGELSSQPCLNTFWKQILHTPPLACRTSLGAEEVFKKVAILVFWLHFFTNLGELQFL